MCKDRITISLGLPELCVLGYEDTGEQHVIEAEKVRCVVFCPVCGNKEVHPTGEERWREVQDLPICGRPVWIHLRQRRFVCGRGDRFWERFDTVALKQRQTKRFQQWLLRQLKGSSVAEAVRRIGIGYRVLEWLVLKIGRHRGDSTRPWPRYLGIDEYASRKGRRYDTVVVDLNGPTIFEVSRGKSAKSLSSLWDTHPGKKRIKGAVIDMSRAFLAGLKALGHRIPVAIDRFHVEKHLFDAVNDVRKRIQQTVSGEEQKRLKKQRHLLCQHVEKLSEKDQQLRNALLSDYPELAWALLLVEYIHNWYDRKQTVPQARKWLMWWLCQVEHSQIPEMRQATKAIKEWMTYILNYFVLFLTNGPTEGMNTKIKLIIREAFGLPSFDRRRARLLFQCGHSP